MSGAGRACRALLLIVLMLVGIGSARAEVPRNLHYEGYLTDAQDDPVNGRVTLTFSIYAGAEGGAPLWSEELRDVAVTEGEFAVDLGAGPATWAPELFAAERWLGVRIGAAQELSPRLRLSGAPFALTAAFAERAEVCDSAETLDGLTVDDVALAGHLHEDRYQRQVQQGCAEGQAIRTIDPDGSVDCQPAGQSVTEEQVDLFVANNGYQSLVTGACLPGTAVVAIHRDGSVECDPVDGQEAVTEELVDGWVADNGYQSRLSSTCPPGQAIRGVQQSGEVACQDVGAGDGYSLDADGGAIEDVVYVSPAGQVGIGTTEPVARLDVDGDLQVSSLAGANLRMVVADAQGRLAAAAVPASGVRTLTADNFAAFQAEPAEVVRMPAVVAINGDFSGLARDGVVLVGGGFRGNGTTQVVFRNGAVVHNATFQDVIVTGNWPVFVQCNFLGQARLPNESVLLGGNISNATIPWVGRMFGVHVNNSTIQGGDTLDSSYFAGSNLGAAGNNLGVVTNSFITNTTVLLGSDGRFQHNHCTRSRLVVSVERFGLIQITGNIFDNLLGGASEAIYIDGADSAYRSYLVSSNNFIIQAGDPQAITVTGQANGFYQVLRITGNNFIKGQKAIGHNGSFSTVVDANLLRATNLGVAAGGAITLGANFSL